MDYGRNDWLAQHTDDAIYERQHMAEDFTEANAATVLLAERVEDGKLIGMRVETKRGAVNLTAQQFDSVLRTIAAVAPEQFLNVARDETGRVVEPDLCAESGLPVEECEELHDYQPPTWDGMLGPVEDGDLMSDSRVIPPI